MHCIFLESAKAKTGLAADALNDFSECPPNGKVSDDEPGSMLICVWNRMLFHGGESMEKREALDKEAGAREPAEEADFNQESGMRQSHGKFPVNANPQEIPLMADVLAASNLIYITRSNQASESVSLYFLV
jgi:hypothetical protein